MYHSGFIIVFEQSVLALEIKTLFIKCTNEYLIKFIFLPGTFGISGCWSSGRPCFEIEYRRREARHDRSEMNHRGEIESDKVKSEKHFRHLGLHQTGWSEFIGDFEIFIEYIFDSRSLSSSEEILGIIHHTHTYAEEVFSRAWK